MIFFFVTTFQVLAIDLKVRLMVSLYFRFLFSALCLKSLKCTTMGILESSPLSSVLSPLCIPNSWITFFLLFVFFFQQCGHLACLTVLTCQVKKKVFSHLTWVLWFPWNTFHSPACSNMSKKKIERLLLSCGQ